MKGFAGMLKGLTVWLFKGRIWWIPAVVAVVAMLIYSVTFGTVGYIDYLDELDKEDITRGHTILGNTLIILAIAYAVGNFLILWFGEEPELPPDAVLTGFIGLLLMPVFAMVICGIGVFPALLLSAFPVQSAELTWGDLKLMITSILGTYLALGLILEIVRGSKRTLGKLISPLISPKES